MSNERGDIRSEEAYALGKMLDHSAWQAGDPQLPRNVTASDIDLVFDNNGWIIFGELSRLKAQWKDISQDQQGQFRVYLEACKRPRSMSVLCTHVVAPELGRRIDTRNDIVSFQAMIWFEDHLITSPLYKGNSSWQNLVLKWFQNSEEVLQIIIDHSTRDLVTTEDISRYYNPNVSITKENLQRLLTAVRKRRDNNL